MLARSNKRGVFALAVVVLLSMGSTLANTELIELRGVGTGATENEAITSALNNAVSQHNGADVSANTRTTSATAQGVVHTDGSGSTQGFAASSTESSSTTFKTAGQVSDYKILERSKDSMGLVHITVLAHIATYAAPGDSDKRQRLAILPARTTSDKYSFYGIESASELSQSITSALESEIVQTRRFSILDRTTLDDNVRELQLIGSDLTSPTEKAKLGMIKGADYLLIPTVKAADYSVQERTATSTGRVLRSISTDLALEVRVIVPATGEVKFSETYDVRQPLGKQGMIDAITHLASSDLVSRIYPLQVIAVPSPGVLVVNEGGRSIQAGEQFVILRQSQGLKDPYTGESLGAVKTPIGTATVDRVDGKVAYLRLVQGDPSLMKIGLEVRLDQAATSQANTPRPLPSAPAGPVKLPYDR